MAAPRQALVTFEDVAVRFSAEEWELLEEWQRELHREVMVGTARLLASIGEQPALPRGSADADRPRAGAVEQEQRGPPSSPSLCALMRLVKDIPEFLFGSSKAGTAPAAAAGRDAAAGSEPVGRDDEAQAALQDSHPDVPGEAALPWPGSPSSTEGTVPGAPQWAGSAGHSPLQGLLNCLRAIAVPTPCRSLLGAVGPGAPSSGGWSPSAAGKAPVAPVTPSLHQLETSNGMSTSASVLDVGTEGQGGLEMSPGGPALEESPVRSLLRSLTAVAVQAPCRDPAGATPAPSRAEDEPRHRSDTGAMAEAVSPCSPEETCARRAGGTDVPGDTRPDGSTRLYACVPAVRMVTKRPFMDGTEGLGSSCSTCSAGEPRACWAAAGTLGAPSPPGSGARPSGCLGVSWPKKRCPRGVPPALQNPYGCRGSPDLRVEMSQLRAVLAEKLRRLCRDVGSVRREAAGVRNRLARLERGAQGRARDLAALTRSRRRLRDAIRHLEGRCWALESRARRNSQGLPEGADTVAFLQKTLPVALGLLPAAAPLQVQSGRRLRGPTAGHGRGLGGP